MLAIVLSIFSALERITYKKACDYSEERGYSDSLLTWVFFALLIVSYGILGFALPDAFAFRKPIIEHWWLVVGIFAFFIVADIACNKLWQYVYAHEKVSVLTPYGEMESVFIILLSLIFPFLSEKASLVSIGAALAVGIVLIVSSFDFKALVFNRYCGWYMLAGFLNAVAEVGTAYLLLHGFTSMTLLGLNDIIVFVFLCGVLVYKRIPVPIRSSEFHALVKLSSVHIGSWLVQKIITFYIIVSSGMVAATLAGMLQFVATIVLAYFMLGDRPKRKDVLLGAFVVLMVSIGFVM